MQALSAVSAYRDVMPQRNYVFAAKEETTTSVFFQDTVSFGQEKPSEDFAMNAVTERAYDKLRAIVGDAREALGLSADAQLDTSPEATATRIADFALNFYDKWREDHTGGDEDSAREEFASYIGGAIQQGIEEARGILGALNVLNGDVGKNIDTTWSLIQDRLNAFVKGPEV